MAVQLHKHNNLLNRRNILRHVKLQEVTQTNCAMTTTEENASKINGHLFQKSGL